MTYALISDVHSDIKSLKKVLDSLDTFSVDKLISLGAQIGYGLFPDAVLAELNKRNATLLMGNHEFALFDKDELETMSRTAKRSLVENMEYLNTDLQKYLKDLPHYLIENNIRFVHGAPPNSFSIYMNRLNDTEILALLELYEELISFCGHSHQSMIYEIKHNCINRIKVLFNHDYKLKSDCRYIINVGSVSFQRNGLKNHKEYVIFDQSKSFVRFNNLL